MGGKKVQTIREKRYILVFLFEGGLVLVHLRGIVKGTRTFAILLLQNMNYTLH